MEILLPFIETYGLTVGLPVGAVALLGGYLLVRKKRPVSEKLQKKKEELAELKAQIEDKAQTPVASKTLREALSQSRDGFWSQLLGKASANLEDLDEIEELLYTSDMGPKTVQKIFSTIEEKSQSDSETPLKEILKSEIISLFSNVSHQTDDGFSLQNEGLTVWMIVGVNGAGKTTSIGKLASQLCENGQKVMIAAGDTFRAAADSQLKVWSERANVEIFSPDNVKDPSAIAFDAVTKAKAKGFDVLIIDTAGRLHTQKNLMEELKKMKRVTQKVMPEAPHEVILVLDANSGQNALIQAEQFHNALDVSGVILTKMDGSAKGGVAVGVAGDVGLPIKMIGVGEGVEDLRTFSPKEFVDSIL